jgi:phage gp46-like protein
MSDFTLTMINSSGFADMSIVKGDFAIGRDLETAVLVSLFSNRRATNDELNDYATGRAKPELNTGLWIDTYRTDIQYGSGLWLLSRSKRSEETRDRYERYADEALKWLVADGVASSIKSTATFAGTRVLLTVVISRESDIDVTATFDFAWDEFTVKSTFTRD